MPAENAAPLVTPQPLLERFSRRRADLTGLAAMVGLYFFSQFHRVGLTSTLFNQVQSDFQVAASVVTGLASVYMIIYAGMQLVVGITADRFGPRLPMVAGGLMLSIGSILLPLSPNLAALYATRVVIALGDSFMYLCLIKQIDRLFGDRHFAPLAGIMLFMGYTGGLVAMTPLAALSQAMGWRHAMLLAGVLTAVMFVIAAPILLRREPPTRRQASTPRITRAAVRQFFASRRVYPNLIYAPIGFAIYLLLQMTIGKKFLQDRAGLGSIAASNVVFAMQLIMILGSPFAGFLPDLFRGRRKPILVVSTFVMIGGSAMLWIGAVRPVPVAWFVSAYGVLALASATGVVGTALFKEINDRAVTAFAVGFFNMMVYVVGALLANSAGWVMDAYVGQSHKVGLATVYPARAYAVIFAGTTVLAIASMLAALKVCETRGVQHRPEME